MKLWLSRQHDGRYMLTALRPVVAVIGRTGRYGVYARPGDPVLLRHLCESMVETLLPGIELEELHSVRVEVTAEVRGESYKTPIAEDPAPVAPAPLVPRHVRLFRRALSAIGCVHFQTRVSAADQTMGGGAGEK
jgi:hypothetical protein